MRGLEAIERESLHQPQEAVLAEQGGGKLLSVGGVVGRGLVLAQGARLADVFDVSDHLEAGGAVGVASVLLVAPRSHGPVEGGFAVLLKQQPQTNIGCCQKGCCDWKHA